MILRNINNLQNANDPIKLQTNKQTNRPSNTIFDCTGEIFINLIICARNYWRGAEPTKSDLEGKEKNKQGEVLYYNNFNFQGGDRSHTIDASPPPTATF